MSEQEKVTHILRSLDEMVDAAETLYLSESGARIDEVVEAVADDRFLSYEERLEAVRYAVSARLHARIGDLRRNRRVIRDPDAFAAEVAAKLERLEAAVDVLARVRYGGRSLETMDIEALRARAELEASCEHGAKQRRRFFDASVAVLEQHGKHVIRGLPLDEITRLRTLAEKAWN